VKRWMVVALVVALTAGVVPAALAGIGTSEGDRSQFMADGMIVDAWTADGVGYVSLTPQTGTRDVKDVIARGELFTVKVAANCELVECVPPPGAVFLDFWQVEWAADTSPGARVLVRGLIDRSVPGAPVYVVYRLQVYADATPPPGTIL
jgi:hypothetical protein